MSSKSKSKRREEIFSNAAEITDLKARAAYLDNACGDDAQLRSEVETLLRHDQDAGSFLERPPEELDATFNSGSPSADGDEAWRDVLTPSEASDCIGTLGPYEVVHLIGRGGMGVVLLARDPKLNRIVAIKLLAPELAAQATAVQRFLREARATAAVSHDHVVSIYAIDDAARPPMIVMEMIDGHSLQQKIDSAGALDVKSILRIGMQTAAGLSAAHRQGLVHRDVKPANIMLENGIEKVKLTDFGLARAVDDIGMTRTGQITGTPQYMSPEQAQGKHVDHRTDLFSLGCVLYAMCTGSAAFRADSAVAVMHRVVHDEPRPMQEINPDVPEWLCDIVGRLLAKNPDERFESAEEVEDLLGRHLAHIQQPESTAMPERVRLSSAAHVVDRDTERILNFVRNVLGVLGSISLLWFLANLFMPDYGQSGFGFTMPTLLFSLVTGAAALNGAWHAHHRRSFGWTLLGNVALIFPINLPQTFGLVFSIWASTYLWRDSVRKAFASQHDADGFEARAHGARSEESSRPKQRAWIRRVPIPTWIALLLFGMVFVGAIVEWSGQDSISSRGNGFVCYLLGTGFVLLWGAVSGATRLIRGEWVDQASLPPTRMHLAAFFTCVFLLTGVFIWWWAELHEQRHRDLLWGFLRGHGTITVELPSPTVELIYNDQTVVVPEDGVAHLSVERWGSYVFEVHNEEGSISGGEILVQFGARISSGALANATKVVVTGPIRGSIRGHGRANGAVEDSKDSAEESRNATAFFRKFERTLQEADAASVIYEGEVATTKAGKTERKSYWGAYQTVKGGKVADRSPKGPAGFQEGGELSAISPFYEPPAYDFYINQITRSGFGKVADFMLARVAMWPVEEMRIVDAAQTPDSTCLAYTVYPKEGQSWRAQLWIDTKTLAPRKRELRYSEDDGSQIVVIEHYRSFNTDAIPDPFGENQLASKLVGPPPARGRLSIERDGKWKTTEWLAKQRWYRAEEATELHHALFRCKIVLNPGCEFFLADGELEIRNGVLSVEYGADPHLHIKIGGVYFSSDNRNGPRITASADRIIAEQGSVRASGGKLEKNVVLREGVEYAILNGIVEEQRERTLPAAPNDEND